MKIFFRLLNYAKPIEKFAIPYIALTILGILFGLINWSLLIPLFDILFATDANKAMPVIEELQEFSFTKNYFKDLFYYSLHKLVKNQDQMSALIFVSTIILISVLSANLFRYLAQRAIEGLRIHILLNLRKALFEKIISMHLGYFNSQRKGVLISKITEDVQVIQGAITNTLIVFFKEPITLLIYFCFLFFLNYKLTLFTILVVPLSALIISTITKNLKKATREAQNIFGIMLSLLDEALSGIKIIKSFNAEKIIQDKFHKKNSSYTTILKSIARRQELASPISEFLGVFTVVAVVIYGGHLITKDNSLNPATFVGYIIVLSQIIKPVKTISSSFSNIQHGLSSGERVLKIIDEENLVKDFPNAKKAVDFDREIEFKNVTFSYENKIILKNINFTIEKGKTIALVGPSGAGKSTISDLIPRFYDPQSGGIYLDGVNLKEYKTETIRSLMGIVGQESILFNDTIFNNISFSKPHATREEVINAAKVAHAHDFILETEHGYDTFIGDRGIKLSGGQKQRISIARAVLKNPPILLLDEATSSLDTESEKLVQDALSSLMKNRTSLVIAHRLSTIQNADEILVLQNGKIVERGKHHELIHYKEGIYNKLKTLQMYSTG